ncbi:MAG: class I SAM-dependent methyltransferase [Woeseia sp.]
MITALRLFAKVLPGDHARAFVYLNLIYKPRSALRSMLNNFYRIDHVYSVIKEFTTTFRGPFSILEFGVADGYSFAKNVFATHYLKASRDIVCHGFDTFEGMPETDDPRDRAGIKGSSWKAGQYRGDYEGLTRYLSDRYDNWRLHKGLFEDSLTPELLEELRVHKPILVWIDCDYYTSARTVMERLIPILPSGAVIYLDEYEFNFGSRFTGEARLVNEINRGDFGADVELVLDKDLSWDLTRCYRFVRENPTIRFERMEALGHVEDLRRRGNDSPLP